MSNEDAIESAQAEANTIRFNIIAEKERLADIPITSLSAGIAPIPRRDIRVRRTLKGHMGKVYSLQWQPWDGTGTYLNTLCSASQDGKIIVWDAVTTCKKAAISLRSSWVMTCSLSASGSLVASGGLDNMCTVHRVDNGEQLQELSGHSGFLSCCRFIDEHKLATSSGDATAMVWDIERGIHIVDFEGHSGDIMCLRVHEPSNTLLTVSLDFTARLWDVRTGKCTRVFVGHDGDVNACEWFPNGHAFATGADDRKCRLFDIRADRLMLEYGHPDVVSGVTSVSFSRSGRELFVGYDDNNCCMWDVLKGDRQTVLAAHNDRVSCVEVSPDGYALATGSWDSMLKIWT